MREKHIVAKQPFWIFYTCKANNVGIQINMPCLNHNNNNNNNEGKFKLLQNSIKLSSHLTQIIFWTFTFGILQLYKTRRSRELDNAFDFWNSVIFKLFTRHSELWNLHKNSHRIEELIASSTYIPNKYSMFSVYWVTHVTL